MMGFLEHLIHHARGQLAGVRVLAARMVAANERLPIRDPMDDTMCERRLRTLMDAAMCQQPYVRVETDCPERGRREADEEQMRIRIHETRNRPCPIGFVRECAALLTPDLQAVRAEAYAAVAPDGRITRRFQRLP